MQNEPKNQAPENNSLDPQARRNARRYALQSMYQWQLSGTSIKDIEAEFLLFNIDKKTDLEYYKMLIYGIPEQVTAIDDSIRPFLSRAFTEIDPIELAVLRIATFELMHRPDVPFRVIINEALELTKKFGSVEGHKFVNGMLDKIARKIRVTEIGMKGKE